MKRIIYFFSILLLICILIISGYFIYINLKENKKQEEIFEELINIIETTDEEQEIDLFSLYKINNDIVGWIRIENTTLDYPVMQSDIENYYLRRNFYKEYSSYGTPYLAYNCDLNSDNLIIYGHHMNNRKMFGCLEDYKTKSFYEENKTICFYILNNEKTIKSEYEIFAVFKTTVYNSNSFKYYSYIDFDDENEFSLFITKVKNLSMYETDIVPQYGDNFITLSTCEYSNKNSRLVIMAKKTN